MDGVCNEKWKWQYLIKQDGVINDSSFFITAVISQRLHNELELNDEGQQFGHALERGSAPEIPTYHEACPQANCGVENVSLWRRFYESRFYDASASHGEIWLQLPLSQKHKIWSLMPDLNQRHKIFYDEDCQ